MRARQVQASGEHGRRCREGAGRAGTDLQTSTARERFRRRVGVRSWRRAHTQRGDGKAEEEETQSPLAIGKARRGEASKSS